MEADFQREYGLSLSACCWGPDAVGPRRLRVLILGLSPHSRLYRTTDGQHWGYIEELLTTLIEVSHLHLQVTVAANSKRKRKPKPLHIDRPTLALVEQRRQQQPKRLATVEDAERIVESIFGPRVG